MRTAWLGITLALVGCSGNGSTEGDAGEDASTPFVEDDAGAPAPVDAGPLWQRCDPSIPGTCPSGLECLNAHTSPVDAYGTCVFSCAGESLASCSLSGGTCACPSPVGLVGNAPGDCSAGNDAGAVTVCVPAGDGGVSGNNEIDDAGGSAADTGVADTGGPG
jgi:hypothetical protein